MEGVPSWRAVSFPTPLAWAKKCPAPIESSVGQVGKGRVSSPSARGQCRCDCPGRDESPCIMSRCPSPTPTFSSGVAQKGRFLTWNAWTTNTTFEIGNKNHPLKGRLVHSLYRGSQAQSGRPRYTTFGSPVATALNPVIPQHPLRTRCSAGADGNGRWSCDTRGFSISQTPAASPAGHPQNSPPGFRAGLSLKKNFFFFIA